MIGVAVLGLVAAVAGTISAWTVVGQLEETVDDSLLLTEATLVTLDDTIVLADGIVESISDSLDALEASLDTAAGSFGSATGVLADASTLSAEVAPSLTATEESIRDLADTAGLLDGFLRGLSAVPFAPDYDPDVGLATRLETIADDLGPAAQTLEGAGENLDEVIADLERFRSDVEDLRDSVAAIGAEVDSSSRLVDEYAARTDEAMILTVDTREDLDRDVAVTRAMIVLGGFAAALFTIVPAWVGRELVREAREGLADAEAADPPEPPPDEGRTVP